LPAGSFRPLDLASVDARRVAEAGVAAERGARWAASVSRGVKSSGSAVPASIDDWGLTLSADPGPGPTATPVALPPEVVRFRPRDGWAAVDRNAQLSVRFTTPMDHATSELAFHATLDGTDLAGSMRWAEGDTVLVMQPAAALPYGALVVLRVDGGALSAAGLPLVTVASITFTVEARPAAPTASGGATSSGWRWPLIGPITQRFGQTLTKYGFHQGIDIDGDTGDPVTAARSGVVVVAGVADECGGLQVRIDHGHGLLSWYRHLSVVETAVGVRVPAGALLGRVGNTGCSLGSHLHFGISRGGVFVDPIRYLPAR